MTAEAQQPSDEQPPDIHGYRILDLIGKGGQGVVYRAKQRSLDRTVAIKVLSSRRSGDLEQVRLFLKEARLASRLSHPNILQGIDVGQCEGRLYFVMEYVSAQNAYEVLRDTGALSEREVLDLIGQVAQAIQYAWERGVIHGDIKPDNIMVCHDGVAKVVDFGIARIMSTKSKDVAGTRGFVAPEVLSGQSDGDIRSELYSVGVTMFELLCGLRPGKMQGAGHLGPDIREANPEISEPTARLISQLLAPNPSHRFQTPDILIQKLRTIPAFEPGYASNITVDAPKLQVLSHRVRRKRSFATSWALPVVLLVVVALGTMFVLKAGKEEPGTLIHKEPAGVPGPSTEPPVAQPPDTTSPVLTFVQRKVTVEEGKRLTVRLEGQSLDAWKGLDLRVLDSAGKEVMPVPEKQIESGNPHVLVVTWTAPWIPGRRDRLLGIVATRNEAEDRVKVRVKAGNRPPTVARVKQGIVEVEAGGPECLVRLNVIDPDEDRVTLTEALSHKTVRVRIQGYRVYLHAPERRDSKPSMSEVRVMASDGQGGKHPVTISVRIVPGVQLISVSVHSEDPGWKSFPATRIVGFDGHRILAAEADAHTLRLRVSHLAHPDGEGLHVGFDPSMDRPRGIRTGRGRMNELSRDAKTGDFLIQWHPGIRPRWGPRAVHLRIWKEGSRPERHLLRLQLLRKIEAGKSEGTLDRALGWLRRHQLDDGRMPATKEDFQKACKNCRETCIGYGKPEHVVGITALTALAALRAGDGSPWVCRLVDYVVAQQRGKPTHWFGGYTEDRNSYDLALATECTALAWHLLGEPRYRRAARLGVLGLERKQKQAGTRQGWKYKDSPQPSDTSATVWSIRALLAARMGSILISDRALSAAMTWVATRCNPETGRIGYAKAGERPRRYAETGKEFLSILSESNTAAGLSVLLQSRQPGLSSEAQAKALDLVASCPPSADLSQNRLPSGLRERLRGSKQHKNRAAYSAIDFCYWQHGTALFRIRAGGHGVILPQGWGRLATILKDAQIPGDRSAWGSFALKDPWSSYGGRTYSTAMLALTLANLTYSHPLVNELE